MEWELKMKQVEELYNKKDMREFYKNIKQPSRINKLRAPINGIKVGEEVLYGKELM